MTVGRPSLAALLLAAGVAAGQQPNRLANDEPEIRLDARGRNGVCDALTFTPDGRTLLAAGEDKVVHRWTVGATGLTSAGPPLSWNTFRERRGSIYALALDAPRGRVAVAGFGKLNPDVAVLDLKTGAVVAALSYPTEPDGSAFRAAREAIWALAFRPDDGQELAAGDGAGNVWVWRLTEKDAAKRTRLAAKGAGLTDGSQVTWVGYLPGGRLAFARRDGGVYEAVAGQARELFRWAKLGMAERVVASGDGKVLAARPSRGNPAGNVVEVRPLAGGPAKVVVAPANHFPERVALDATGRRLAVGYIDYTGHPATGFKHDRPGEVRLYDLTADPPTEIARSPRLPMCPDQIAFAPDGKRLATADAEAHGTSLWAINGAALKRQAAEASDTRPIWAVGLTADGQHLSFKTDREPFPAHPNRRAAANTAWTTFDLTDDRRGWAAKPVTPVPPEDQRAGWRVKFDVADDYHWRVVEPNGTEHPLADVWDKLRDDLPRCYTFLPGPAGGVRLAVGHLWGVSVFTLAPGQKPVRVRKLTGHAGYVTAVAPTHGGNGLVTAGRDHTIAFWNLADFDHQPLLGAAFAERNGQVVVAAVADGSPADEAGLATGDAVVGVMVGGAGKEVPPADGLRHFRQPRPETELAVKLSRAGWAEPRWTKTSLLHRPVAKFVPLRRDEWLLYTYRQCYYDSSANGDRAVQWLVSKGRADQTPDVFPVGDFRDLLKKPDKVSAVLDRQQREPAKPELVEKFPPRVELTVLNPVVGNDNDPVEARVVVTPRATPSGRTSQVEAVELWLNDHHRVGRTAVAVAGQAADQPLPAFTFRVPNSDLVGGANKLTARVLARDGSWGTTGAPKAVQLTANREAARRLFGVAAGVTDYNSYKISPNQNLDLLNSADDAARVLAAWAGLRDGGGYVRDDAALPLLKDGAATKAAILGHIRAAKGKARPADVFVLVLSGHGIRGDADGKLESWVKGAATDHWYFVTPAHASRPLTTGDFRQPARVKEVCLSAQEVFEAMADLPCWKVVLLDCCHSGQAAKGALTMTKNSASTFRAGGLGPVVLAACAENQLAVEPAKRSDDGGVFSRQVVTAFGRDFQTVAGKDGRLSAADLAEYIKKGVSRDAAKYTDDNDQPFKQDAVVTPLDPADLKRLVLAEKKSGGNPPKPVGDGD